MAEMESQSNHHDSFLHSRVQRISDVFRAVTGGRDNPPNYDSGPYSIKDLMSLGTSRFGKTEKGILVRFSSISAFDKLLKTFSHPGNLLEIGTGDGAISRELANRNAQIDTYIALERNILGGRSFMMNREGRMGDIAVIANGTALPIASDSVDTVLSIASFDIMGKKTLPRTVEEIDRVLARNGVVIFAVDLLGTEAMMSVDKATDIYGFQQRLEVDGVRFRNQFDASEVEILETKIRVTAEKLKAKVHRRRLKGYVKFVLAQESYTEIIKSVLEALPVDILSLFPVTYSKVVEPLTRTISLLALGHHDFKDLLKSVQVDIGRDNSARTYCDLTSFFGLTAILMEDLHNKISSNDVDTGIEAIYLYNIMSLLSSWILHEMNIEYITSSFRNNGFSVKTEGWEFGDKVTSPTSKGEESGIHHVNFVGLILPSVGHRGFTEATSAVRYLVLSRE